MKLILEVLTPVLLVGVPVVIAVLFGSCIARVLDRAYAALFGEEEDYSQEGMK